MESATQGEEASAKPVQVIVQNLAGKTLQFEASTAQSILEVKAVVFEQWGLPVVCQQLMLDADVLQGTRKLAELSQSLSDGQPLMMLCVYSMPYEGSIEKASAAGDREAVRALMQERDKDRERVPALLTLLIHRRHMETKGWPHIAEALVDRGYTVEEVDAAIASMPGNVML